MEKFFEGLSEDEKLILKDINGLAGLQKKNQKTNFVQNQINETSEETTDINLDFTKEPHKTCSSNNVNQSLQDKRPFNL